MVLKQIPLHSNLRKYIPYIIFYVVSCLVLLQISFPNSVFTKYCKQDSFSYSINFCFLEILGDLYIPNTRNSQVCSHNKPLSDTKGLASVYMNPDSRIMSVYFCEEQRSTDDESLGRQQSGYKVMTKTEMPLGIVQGVEWKQRLWKQCCSI